MLWFTGLSGSGKTTVAEGASAMLEREGIRTCLIDGDTTRSTRHQHLGFSETDILTNNALIAELCAEERQRFDVVLVPIISPYRRGRDAARNALGRGFYEIHLSANLGCVSRRDVKGLYSRAAQGEIQNLIGVSPSNPYEVPTNPDLVLDTERESAERSTQALYSFAIEKLGRSTPDARRDANEFPLSAGKRVDVFICGAAKSGTQMLISALAQTGYIDVPRIIGEPNFFTMRFDRGLDWYHRLFEDAEAPLYAEASPTYMSSATEFLSRVLDYNPDARFIFILRNPVRRAWAQYWGNVRKGNEPLPPIEAFHHEDERIKVSRRNFYKFGYKARSRYYEQLLPFFDTLDRNRLHVIVLENYRNDPAGENERLQRFLGLPSSVNIPETPAQTRLNPGGLPKFRRSHHLLSRHKRLFWHLEATRRLWKFLNHTNLIRWGRPYPNLDEPCERHLREALVDDRQRLCALLGWSDDPWAAKAPETTTAASPVAREKTG